MLVGPPKSRAVGHVSPLTQGILPVIVIGALSPLSKGRGEEVTPGAIGPQHLGRQQANGRVTHVRGREGAAEVR